MNQNRKKKGNYPNLRFPEFEGEWEEKRLGEVAEIVGGGTPDTTIEEYWNGNIQWFTPSEIKASYVSKSERTITELGVQKSSAKLLPIGAILLTTRATIGETAITKNICTTNQGFQSLIVNKQSNNIFIANWIKRNTKELVKRSNGSTFLEINKSEIEKIPISIPSKVEQNKIAIFLSLIDERIEAQRKIIEDLELLKSAISNKLLLNDNWTEYQIRDIATIGRGRVINADEIKIQHNPKYPVYSSQTSNDGIMGYLDNYDFEGEYVTWTTDGANAGTVFYRNGKFNCTNVCGTLKIDNKHNPYFVSLSLGLVAKKYVFVNLANPKLMNNVMAGIKISLPESDVQDEISRLFQNIQIKIKLENSLLISYIEMKKYLLQNLII